MIQKFSKKMYVRCPIDVECPDEPRNFILGKIKEINDFAETVEVSFFDLNGLTKYYLIPKNYSFSLTKITHAHIRKNAIVKFNNKMYSVVSFHLNKDDGFYYYFLSTKFENNIIKVCETEITAAFNDGEVIPTIQMANYEFQNPLWYFGRNIVSKTIRIINNTVYGLKELAGCKIKLMPHQLKTVTRCLQEPECRFMLADEVGLGKTIEALSVLKIFLSDHKEKNILIITPDSLTEQWKTEMSFKFNMSIGKNVNENNIVLMPFSNLNVIDCANHYDFLIIDEIHQLVTSDDLEYYNKALTLSMNSKNVLMLSATPIQSREKEYHKLLSLIQPKKYEQMPEHKFNNLMELQKKIIRRVHGIYDEINDYILEIKNSGNKHTEDTEDIFNDIIDDIQAIANLTDDKLIYKMITKINYNSENFGIDNIQFVVCYIYESYQLEKCIIRNRNVGIKPTKRKLISLPYDIGNDFNFSEQKTYNLMTEWIDSLELTPEKYKKHYSNIVQSFFSSAAAFKKELNLCKSLNIPTELFDAADNWALSELDIIKNINEILVDDVDKYQCRIVNIINYIDQEAYKEKVLLFTGNDETFLIYQKVLISYFGEENCCFFSKKMDKKSLELNTYRFQNSEQYKIMLSDETGGEGRNFQIADKVIHIDIPWSANTLEQRIGRLDRIGRKENSNVTSVVMYAIDTIEEQLFNFWNQGINIFEESQPGLEIIMNELDNDIINSLCENFKYGLKTCVEKIILPKMDNLKKAVKEERHYDVAASKNQRIYKQIESTIDKYNNNESELFSKAMLSWASLAGFTGHELENNIVEFTPNSFSPKSAANTLFEPPKDLLKLINSSINQMQNTIRQIDKNESVCKDSNVIIGTFDRNIALKDDYMHFYAPGDEIFDSIVNNAIYSYKGRCSAFAYKSGFDWEGFILGWFLKPNEEILLNAGISLRQISQFNGYMPTELLFNTYSINSDSDIKEKDVLSVFNEILNHKFSKIRSLVGNYGQRHIKYNDYFEYGSKLNISNMEWFKENYNKERWYSYVSNAYKISKKDALNQFSKKFKQEEFIMALEETLGSNKASAFFDNNYIPSITKDNIKVIYESFRKPEVVLDSICYVRFMK